MKRRCTVPSHPAYKWYGAKGITVCARWLGEDGFSNFMMDLGPKPGPGYSLERKDNKLGYSKENCVWATQVEQQRNRSNNKLTQIEAEWIRFWDSEGFSRKSVASAFSVSKSMVCLIVNNKVRVSA